MIWVHLNSVQNDLLLSGAAVVQDSFILDSYFGTHIWVSKYESSPLWHIFGLIFESKSLYGLHMEGTPQMSPKQYRSSLGLYLSKTGPIFESQANIGPFYSDPLWVRFLSFGPKFEFWTQIWVPIVDALRDLSCLYLYRKLQKSPWHLFIFL